MSICHFDGFLRGQGSGTMMYTTTVPDELAHQKGLEPYPGPGSQLADRPRYYGACASILRT